MVRIRTGSILREWRDSHQPLEQPEPALKLARLRTTCAHATGAAAPGAMEPPELPPHGSGRIAQLVEQLTLNQRVLGSSPSASTIFQ